MMYDKKFYDAMTEPGCSNYSSAKEIVPFILSLFPNTKSVIDFGCGTGAWLSVFRDSGISDVLGLDGEWISIEDLMVDKDQFLQVDLEKRLEVGHRFDLAISTEVAEHISPENADTFVENMIRHSDVIIFGAAIPNQGGVHHVNEQWQSYWSNKFEKRGYIAIDPIRGKFSDNPMVKPMYVQNILVYINKEKVSQYDAASSYVNIPFVKDYALPCYVLDNSKHSWRFLLRLQHLIINKVFRKIFRLREYGGGN